MSRDMLACLHKHFGWTRKHNLC